MVEKGKRFLFYHFPHFLRFIFALIQTLPFDFW